jgi:hypothetical protein
VGEVGENFGNEGELGEAPINCIGDVGEYCGEAGLKAGLLTINADL